MSVRVRYAPSPTGLQHIGGVRTALFNYFFAKVNGGDFILRLEDTDRQRCTAEAESDLRETFAWLGVEWDEGPDKGGPYGPYVQSQRVELYRNFAKQLIDRGQAYHCYCSTSRLERLRQDQQRQKSSLQGYDRKCRNLSEAEKTEAAKKNSPSVVRLKIPQTGKVVLTDQLLGKISRKVKDINPDPVLLKADGFPTYHLANVIDDHLMKISHIMRAQEWLPSGPLHLLLYQAFGWEPPLYCHLPMVMGKDGQKLSKRHGATSILEFRKQGYLPEAIINYVSLVGWSYDDATEFFSKSDLEELFSVDKLNKAPGVFDYQKLKWFNGHYLRQKTVDALSEMIAPYLINAQLIDNPPTQAQKEIVRKASFLIQERLKTLDEAPALLGFLFNPPSHPEPSLAVPKKSNPGQALANLDAALSVLREIDELSDECIENQFRQAADRLGVKLGQLLQPARYGLTDSLVSPPLIGSARLLGGKETKNRLERLAQKLARL